MRLIVIQHCPATPAGLVGEVAEAAAQSEIEAHYDSGAALASARQRRMRRRAGALT